MITSTVNQAWNISDKVKEKQGEVWANIDFEINPKFSSYQYKNNPMETKVGRIFVCGKKIIVTYKELLRASAAIDQQVTDTFFLKVNKDDQLTIYMLSNKLYLKKHELGRLSETLEDSITTIQRSYRLGLYL